MCFSQSAPRAPVIRQEPSRDEQRAETQDARRRAREQAGMYDNIFTSALGDSSYGSNVASVNEQRSAPYAGMGG